MSEQIKGMVSTMIKRQNTGASDPPAGGKKGKPKLIKRECLAADCGGSIIYSLCPLHYHSLVSAKLTSLKLRNGYGDATFDTASNMIVYPAKTLSDRLPIQKPKKASN
jgi:hypothetical protein